MTDKRQNLNSAESLDSGRERFFGWIPRNKKSKGILLFYVIYFFICLTICPYMPAFLIFGWISSAVLWNWLFTAVGLVVGGIYYSKHWPALKEDEDL